MDVYVKSVISILEQYDLELLDFIRDLSNQICKINFFMTNEYNLLLKFQLLKELRISNFNQQLERLHRL
jgi:hypothetical protein